MTQPNSNFHNVYWMGGSPCSGKTSIARILAEKHGLQVYTCDDHFDKHVERAHPRRQPRLNWVSRVSWDDLFMRPVTVQVKDEIAIYQEELSMIMDDLHALSSDRPLLVEGAALLPESLLPYLKDPSRAIWIVPSEPFQRKIYPQRGEFVRWILDRTTEPKTAMRNWMDRDVAFARWVETETHRLGLKALTVTGETSIEQNATAVEQYFSLG